MIKSREPALERVSVTAQVFITLICFYVTLLFSGFLAVDINLGERELLIVSILMAPIWFVLLELFELGAMSRIQRYRHLILKYAAVISIGSFLLMFLIEFLDFQTVTSFIILKFAIINFFILSWQKITSRSLMKYFRKNGYNTRMIIIFADDSSIPFINQIIESGEWGYIIKGIITNSNKVKQLFENQFKVYSERDDFTKIIDDNVIDEVFFCQNRFNTNSLGKRIAQCQDVGVSFHIHNNVLVLSGLKPRLSFLNQQFFLSFRNTPSNYFALKIKGTIDFFLTLLILLFISPFTILIALMIKLDDGGPIFFKQVRVGRHGRQFKLLKFRTMVIDAEAQQKNLMDLNEQDGPVFKIKNDPRITKIGKFLRKTSLDELPQFINVLLGDMSIVGPKPPIPSEVNQYERSLKRRLSINPGITCIWQVSGRNNIPFDKWMEMDMEYIDNWSLKLDFIIILKTFKVLFAGDGQ